ncbi:MAG: hypothetical protein M5U12_17595 [Verrucomicrobia bacterium]|nr:hypothetical protein [Verrucomicrobiota bacterium]
MQPELPRVPLADQPWFVDLLAGKGFYRSSPTTFTNGRASIQVAGTKFVADPGTGDKSWNSDLAEATPETIKLILQQILKTRPFLTEADLTEERADKQRIERALMGIAATIKEGPGTGSGVQLRRFLWALYNQHHLVNLWRMTAVLDSKRAGWVSEAFAGALVGSLKEDDTKRALLAAGEMERWDQVRPDTETLEKLDEAERIVSDLVRRTPPSHAHTELADLLSRFATVKREIRAQEPTP